MDDGNDWTDLTDRAKAAGITLMQRETDNGQLVWSWIATDQSRGPVGPTFLTRRAAMDFLRDRLGPQPEPS